MDDSEVTALVERARRREPEAAERLRKLIPALHDGPAPHQPHP